MKILRFKQLNEMVGLSRSTIDRLEKRGEFPIRIHLGENSVGWRQSEIEDWIQNKISGLE